MPNVPSIVPREMTPQEKEEYRSLQVKVHYCELIQYEIQKLNNEQLYKMLVLIKNTIDQNAEQKHIPKNEALFDTRLLDKTAELLPSRSVREASDEVRLMVATMGLTKGYGLFMMTGFSTEGDGVSNYICFCIPDRVDCMVEVYHGDKNNAGYVLSHREVGMTIAKAQIFYGTDTLTEAVETIKKTYT
jgi:hypothetical protein